MTMHDPIPRGSNRRVRAAKNRRLIRQWREIADKLKKAKEDK